MPSFVTLIIAALATHRLSLAIAEEEGPFSIFTKVRGRLDPDQKTWLGRGVNCIMCVGFWVALPTAFWLGVLGIVDPYLTPIVWLGLAGSVVIIRRWEQKR